MDRTCAACNSPCGTAHNCISCGKAVHSIVLYESVWMPNEDRYFCGEECVIAHNEKKSPGGDGGNGGDGHSEGGSDGSDDDEVDGLAAM